MEKRNKVKEIVINLIREYLPKKDKDKEITGDIKIMGELLKDGDDATEIADEAEKILQTKIPIKAWNNVHTVDNMIDLLLEHIPKE